MKRFLCGGVLLSLCAWHSARAGLHGVPFVYKQADGDMAYLQPMYAPQIGVQLEKGPRQINKGEYLVCKPGVEKFKVVFEGKTTDVSSMTLACDDRVFIVRGIRFEEQ